MTEQLEARRPIASRNRGWAKTAATALSSAGVTPNQISVASIVFAAAAGACIVGSPWTTGWPASAMLIGAALFIQMRLICNLLDGMVAIEGGARTKSGEIFNEFPDRIADTLIIVPLGYALPGYPHAVEVGWLAGLLAALTAYTRVLGGATGAGQHFLGPMAKQHRMAVVTVALALAAGAITGSVRGTVLWLALLIVSVGSALTVVRRLTCIVRILESD